MPPAMAASADLIPPFALGASAPQITEDSTGSGQLNLSQAPSRPQAQAPILTTPPITAY